MIYFYPRPPRGGRHAWDPDKDDAVLFLSTPSARRATACRWCRSFHLPISIHALREEGDMARAFQTAKFQRFLSTPSARRATVISHVQRPPHRISIHALREEGDVGCRWALSRANKFLSTPSARRATGVHGVVLLSAGFLSTPSARRATAAAPLLMASVRFLSTPSARRATARRGHRHTDADNFYPRPPRGGRPCGVVDRIGHFFISIHALREEGDFWGQQVSVT